VVAAHQRRRRRQQLLLLLNASGGNPIDDARSSREEIAVDSSEPSQSRTVHPLAASPTAENSAQQGSLGQVSATDVAAVAAAEAIAAEAAAGIAAEAAAVAAEVVSAASRAAAKAAARASLTAAEAASEVAAVAAAVFDTASDAADKAATRASHAGEQAPGEIAAAAAVADGVVHAASAAAAKAAARASDTGARAAAEIAAEAATVAADVVHAASAAAARVIEAGDAAAELVLATAAAAAAATPTRQGLAAAAGDADATPGAPGSGADQVRRTERATRVTDPGMPGFVSGTDQLRTVAGDAALADQGLGLDLPRARPVPAALWAGEAQFEEVLRSAPTAMLVASLAGGQPARFVQVNQAMSQLTGYSPDRLLRFGFADLAPAQHRTYEEAVVGPDERDAEPVERLRRWVHADGHEMWVRIRMAAVCTSAGRAEQLVCQVEDVTAQLRADAAVRSSEALFRLAFSVAPQPAALVDLTGTRPGRLVAINRAACTMFGRSEIEMSWLGLESLTDPADRLAVLDLLDQLSSGQLSRYEGRYRYRKAAGDPGWLRLSGHVVHGADGTAEHLLAYLRDDTDSPMVPPASSGPAVQGRTSAPPNVVSAVPAHSTSPAATDPDSDADQPFVFDAAWVRALD